MIATGAKASTITVPETVNGLSGPWLWNTTSLNKAYQYGVNDQLAPTVVDGSSGLSFTAGNTLNITYVSGLVNYHPAVFATGFNSLGNLESVANNFFSTPSNFIPGAEYPVYGGELVGTFADGAGDVVGTPFVVGLGRSVTIPVGATRLQLGVNDNFYSDNIGSWNIDVAENTAVPEPTAILGAMTALGLGIGLKRQLKGKK